LQKLTFVRAPVLGCDLLRRGELLGLVLQAVVGEVVLALVAYRVVHLAVRTERHAAGVMVGATREPIDEIHRLADCTGGCVVRKARDFGAAVKLLTGIRVVRVSDVDVVRVVNMLVPISPFLVFIYAG